ncbi:MAG TPA: outer membrane protein assembly factor BamD, partial [Caldithrix sp.]|nr:outer membrane protein assembly factor BamD [Caldithrix sp.]
MELLKKYTFILLMAMLLMQISIPLQAASLEDEIDKKYQKAYTLVLDEKWEQAIKEFQSLLDKYPDSDWADDAQYWSCFAAAKIEKSLENAIKCYEDFVEAYPKSNYRDEAEGDMVQIAKELAEEGNQFYLQKLESMQQNEDEEIAMTALLALAQRGDEKAQMAV